MNVFNQRKVILVWANGKAGIWPAVANMEVFGRAEAEMELLMKMQSLDCSDRTLA